ncbi:MAG: methyltransferase domain-containing protein [SAR324 cluster bacterium]|nr:methyltransferase domain-containing protein [SAR324 cluster bacterium]
MKADEIKWNERYRTGKYPLTVNDVVESYFHFAEPGRALDIAAGNGRNALFLAENGFLIDAVDISGVALEMIQAKNPAINCLHEDLDTYIPDPESYNLIINVNFLDRRLFPYIQKALKKDGILIFRTFLDTHLMGTNQTNSRKNNYLCSNELLQAFISFQILLYREQEFVWANGLRREAATLVARKRVFYPSKKHEIVL